MKPKSSNVQNHNSFLQNKLTSEIYLQFEKIVKKNIGSKPFVACISGGPDSLALALCLKFIQKEIDKSFLFNCRPSIFEQTVPWKQRECRKIY